MKTTRILLTGGETGGHIYPLLAVADELLKTKSANLSLQYLGPTGGFDEEFEKRNIKVSRLIGSKLRRYFDLRNLIDIPKFFVSVLEALIKMYFIMPDVVFSKGGPGALAVVLAARFYCIPVLIHESDSVPGFTNRISGKLAARIGIAFQGAVRYFATKKTALVGNPVRQALLEGQKSMNIAKTDLRFDPKIPLLLVLGGSQGAQRINLFVFDNLAQLLKEVQVYHQVGPKNIGEAKRTLELLMKELPAELKSRYQVAGFLDMEHMRLAMNAADVVLSRAGAGGIYETAAFGKPSVLVPIPREVVGEHQILNAYEYAKTGAAIVIEEKNFTIHLFLRELKRILTEAGVAPAMSAAAKSFFKPNAAALLTQEILRFIKPR